MLRATKQINTKIQKKQQLNFLNKQTIVNPKVLIDPSERSQHKKIDMYHLVGERVGNIAVLNLNREYKNNLLTPTMISELNRFLQSYELDPTIKAVQLQGNTGAPVSKGTDFAFILHNSLQGNIEANSEYLRSLFELAHNLSKYNKPLLMNINGPAYNSAAALFSSVPFTLPSSKTQLKFNDIDFGMTPLMGTSYQLSRLPYELGTYLLLTGKQLQGKEILKSGIAKKYMLSDKNLTQNLLEAQQDYDDTYTTEELYGDQYLEDKQESQGHQQLFYETLQQEIQDRILNTDNKVEENKKLAMAEIMYKKQQAEHANAQTSDFSRLGYQNQQFINHLHDYECNVLDKLNLTNLEFVDDKQFDEDFFTSLPIHTINWCFSANSIEEICQRLEKENSHWSLQTLELLQQKNKLALKLSLELIRQGRNSDWKTALQNEFRVAVRRSQDKDFQNSVEYFFQNNNQKQIENPDLQTSLSDISKEQVLNYFQPLQETEEFGQNLIEKGLYPVKEYYEEIPDVIRYFLNEESIQDPNIKEGYYFDVKAFLHSKNIDFLRSWTMETGILRENIFQKEFQKNQIKMQLDKIANLASNYNNTILYKESKKQWLQNYFNQDNIDESLKTIVNDQIAEIFDQYYENRLENLKEISEKAFIEQKQDFFLQIRKTIFDSRLVENKGVNTQIFEADTPLDLRFPEKNSENIFDAQLQNAQKSPIYELVQELESQKQENKEFLIENFNINSEKIHTILKNLENKTYQERTFAVENPDNTDKRIQEYQHRFGDPFGEDTDIYLDSLVKHCSQKQESIGQFINKYSTEEIREIIKQERQLNYRKLGEKLLQDIEQTQIDKESNISSYKESGEYKAAQQLIQEVQTQNQSYSKLLDLQIQQQNNNNTKQQQQNNNNLQQFIENDRGLTQILSVFLTKQSDSKAVQTLQQKFQNILQNVYKGKVDQILQKEKELTGQEQGLEPFLTIDGKSQYKNFNNNKNTSVLDEYLQGNLNQDFHNFISSHIFFTFSAIALDELSELFKNLYSVSRKFNLAQLEEDSVQKIKNMMQTVRSQLNIPIENAEEIQLILDYLNNATEQSCLLYMMYKNKLIFPEDKLLFKAQQSQHIKERDYGELSFANYVLTAYETMKKSELQLQKENADVFEHQSLEYKQLEDHLRSEYNIVDASKTSRYIGQIKNNMENLQSYKQEKSLVQAAVLYVEKLDLLTQQIIHGRDHFLPEEEKQMLEELPEILRNIDPASSSEDWFQLKLKKFLDSVFEIRYKFEKNMTKHELAQFDIEISKFLTPEYLKQQMQYELSEELSNLRKIGDILQFKKKQSSADPLVEEYRLKTKEQETKIRNFDAQQKLLAFQVVQMHNPDNLENNFFIETEEDQKTQQNRQQQYKGKNARILNEQRQRKENEQIENMPNIWSTQDRLTEEIHREKEAEFSDLQEAYKSYMGMADLEIDSKMEVSEKIRKMKDFQFSKEELSIPIRLLVQEGSSTVSDPLRQEIQNFLKTMN